VPGVPVVPVSVPVPVPVFDPSVMKLTRGHSCVLCQQRKVRCDKNKPCANCVKAQVECRVVPPQPPRRRKKKPHERELVDRLKKYEALLNQHGVTFEPIAHDFKSSDPSTIDEVDELQHDLIGLKTSPSSSNQEYSSEHGQGSDRYVAAGPLSPLPFLGVSHLLISGFYVISWSSNEPPPGQNGTRRTTTKTSSVRLTSCGTRPTTTSRALPSTMPSTPCLTAKTASPSSSVAR